MSNILEKFACSSCGKISAGRRPYGCTEGEIFPRKHKVDGKKCKGEDLLAIPEADIDKVSYNIKSKKVIEDLLIDFDTLKMWRDGDIEADSEYIKSYKQVVKIAQSNKAVTKAKIKEFADENLEIFWCKVDGKYTFRVEYINS